MEENELGYINHSNDYVKENEAQFHYLSGEVMARGQFTKDTFFSMKRIGLWHWFYRDGTLKEEEIYIV